MQNSSETCSITGETYDTTEMLCFVVSPMGVLTLDLAQKLPGERRWVYAHANTLHQAVTEAASAPLFAGLTPPPSDFAAHIGWQLKEKALQSLGMVRRAGFAVKGFEKVSRLLKSSLPATSFKNLPVLVIAKDAVRLKELTDPFLAPSDASSAKEFTSIPSTHVIQCLDEEALAFVCGGQHIAYIGLKPHPLTCCFLRDIRRYERYNAQ